MLGFSLGAAPHRPQVHPHTREPYRISVRAVNTSRLFEEMQGKTHRTFRLLRYNSRRTLTLPSLANGRLRVCAATNINLVTMAEVYVPSY